MAPKNLIPEITLTEEDQQKLSKRLNEMVDDAESFHSTWEQLHNQYMRQYLCEPETEVKTYPWSNASNLVLPIGRVVQDATLSQLHDAMFANNPPMKVIAGESKRMASAERLSLYYGDHVWKQIIPLTNLGNLWNFNTLLDGTAALLPRWERRQQLVRKRTLEVVPSRGRLTDQGFEERISEDVGVEKWEGPVIDNCDMAKIYFAPDTGLDCNPRESLQYPNCRSYYVMADLTIDDLYDRKRRGYSNIDAGLIASLGQRDQTDIEKTVTENEQLSSAVTQKTTPLCEFYMRLVLPARLSYGDSAGKRRSINQKFGDPEGFSEDCIVRFWKATGKIANIIPLQRVCPDGRRPHILNWFNCIPGRIYGQGVQAKMKMLNDWISTMANQATDFGHIATLPFFFYVPHMTGLLPDIGGMAPGQGIPVNDPRGINIPRFQQDTMHWLSMIQLGQGYAERDSTISDQTVGRMPEKSANKTARGMMMVQQMMSVAFGRLAALMVTPYIDVFRSVHELHRRNVSRDVIFRIAGRDERLTPDDFQQDVDFEFMIAPNRQFEQQVTQSLFALMMQIPYVSQNPYAVRALARQVYNATGNSIGYRNFDEFWPETMTPKIVEMQQQEIMAQSAGGSPATGQPPAGPPAPMMPGAGATPPPEAMPGPMNAMGQMAAEGQPIDMARLGDVFAALFNRAEETEAENNVTLQ